MIEFNWIELKRMQHQRRFKGTEKNDNEENPMCGPHTSQKRESLLRMQIYFQDWKMIPYFKIQRSNLKI